MPADGSSYLTTGQAARLCSVTPDTILKWIKRGRLAGTRTAGGHFRIERRDLEPYIPSLRVDPGSPQNGRGQSANIPHCWELFTDNGNLRENCEQCVVFKVGAERCFVMAGLDVEVGHSRHFCQSSCDDCVYYRRVQGMATNVLLITPDDVLIRDLTMDESERVNLRFAHGGYEASAILSDFRPAFVAIDVELLLNGEASLLESLSADVRIPGMRVILVVPPGMSPPDLRPLQNDDVVGVLERPFAARDLTGVVSGHEVDSGMLSCADPWTTVGAESE